MAAGTLTKMVDRLRATSQRKVAAFVSDGQQLERFIASRDEAALAELIRRHGPMVFGVCCRILANHADAEDAFQATFLVLVRKAPQVVPRELVGHWLYGVARRTALCAKKSSVRRRESFGGMVDMPCPKPPGLGSELLAVLDEELARLPEKYRVPIVLCELEGRTLKQAAQQLALPEGTLASRLHRARAMLTARMKRHDTKLVAGSLTALLSGQANGIVPAGLMSTTAKSGAAFAIGAGTFVGITAHVAQLTEGVLKLMLLTKIKTASSAVIAIAMLVGGGVAIHAATRLSPTINDDPPVAKAQPEKKADAKPVSRLQGLWNDLAGTDDVKMTKAVLALATTPKESVPFFQTQLRPVKVDPKKVEKWIADLANDKEAVRDAAAKELDYIAPLIQEELDDAAQNAPNDETRQRIVKILLDIQGDFQGGFGGVVVGGAVPAAPIIPAIPAPPGGGAVPVPPPAGAIQIAVAGRPMEDTGDSRASWKQAVRAVTILEHIGNPEAIATLKKMAEGDAKASPTKTAKEALARMEKTKQIGQD